MTKGCQQHDWHITAERLLDTEENELRKKAECITAADLLN